MKPDQSLLYACYCNDILLIKERLANVTQAQLKKSTQETGTPLHQAALYGNKEVVDLLIAAGANLHAGNFFGNNPMLTCIENGRLELAKYLIEKGTDLEKQVARTEMP